MTDDQVRPPEPPCPPCWWCSNPDRWAVIDNEIVRLEDGEEWSDR